MMSDDEETLCAAAVSVASVVVSSAEEQRAAAECKSRTQWVRPLLVLLRSSQQFGAYELLLSELRGSMNNRLLYAEFTRVLPEDFDFLLTAIAPCDRIKSFPVTRPLPGTTGNVSRKV